MKLHKFITIDETYFISKLNKCIKCERTCFPSLEIFFNQNKFGAGYVNIDGKMFFVSRDSSENEYIENECLYTDEEFYVKNIIE